MKFSAAALFVILPYFISAASAAAASAADTSLTLDPAVVSAGFENNGQAVQEAGQVPSLTSSNNFINFCLNKGVLTNGAQVTGGSCNTAPMGQIPSSDNMPSSKFQVPVNMQNFAENTPFTIKVAMKNIQMGSFTNAQQNYYAAPQQLNAQGQIIGHTHVVIETIPSLTSTDPTNPKVFAFFKGINTAAVGGVVSADVTAGLAAGVYRIATINAAMNHQPVLAPIAQHGSLDDMVYFSVGAAGAAQIAATGGPAVAAAGAKGAAAAPPAAASSAAPAASSAAAPAPAGGAKAVAGGKGGKGAAAASSVAAPASSVAAKVDAAGASNAAADPKATPAAKTGGKTKAAGGKAGGKAGKKGKRFIKEAY